MNAAAELIQRCTRQGIQLTPHGGKLRVIAAPGKPLTPELLDTLKAYKPAILAALAHEDAVEYVNERSAICEADDLPPCGIRPVFLYVLTDDPATSLTMLGVIGQTLTQAHESLFDRYGARLLSVADYVYPPPERVQ